MYKPKSLLTLIALLFCVSSLAQEFTSSNLPIIVIETAGQSIPDDSKILADMGIIYNGDGSRNEATAAFNHFAGKIGIETRGSSSQFFFPKKQYGLELRQENGDDLDSALLGLPSEEDWILFAPYNDKTLMRDVLAYQLGRDMGRYAPRTKFCELVLNGSYQGVYVLIEKIKRGKNRVDIKRLDPDDASGDDLTGGYILKIDKFTGTNNDFFQSKFNPPSLFLYHYPEPDEITTKQREYIQEFIEKFETALRGPDFKNPDVGYARYIDVESFVDYFIMNELTKNVDGYRLSTFLHKQRDSDGGKLVMGPIWDYNLSFGNANYCTSGTTEGLVIGFNSICSDDPWQVPFWWYRLLADRAFASRVHDRWTELRANKFSTASLHGYIDSVASVLDESQKRNFERWPFVMGEWIWPNLFVGETYEEEVQWMKEWITARTAWLDNEFDGYGTTTTDNENEVQKISVKNFASPFSESLLISLQTAQAGSVEVELFDSMGRQVDYSSILCNRSGKHEINVGGSIKDGLYICRVRFNGSIVKQSRVIKQH